MNRILALFICVILNIIFPIIFIVPIIILGIVINVSPRLNQIWYSFYYSKIISHLYDYECAKLRESLFSDLSLVKSSDPKLLNDNAIRILEVGAGNGLNLKYYPNNCRFISVDCNPHFEKYLNDALKLNSHVIFEKFINARGEDMKEHVPDESVDVVVMTAVLTFSKDIGAMINEAHRVLAKGGKLYVMQTIAYPKNTISYKIQNFFNPISKLYFGGCQLIIDPLPFIEQIHWNSIEMKIDDTSFESAPVMIKRVQLLVATK